MFICVIEGKGPYNRFLSLGSPKIRYKITNLNYFTIICNKVHFLGLQGPMTIRNITHIINISNYETLWLGRERQGVYFALRERSIFVPGILLFDLGRKYKNIEWGNFFPKTSKHVRKKLLEILNKMISRDIMLNSPISDFYRVLLQTSLETHQISIKTALKHTY